MYDSHTIVWEKWVDPFGLEDDTNDVLSLNEEPQFIDEDHPDDNKSSTQQPIQFKHFKAVATPMGIIPINDNTTSGKIFNFWVGHTNFNISKPIADVIESTEGVETLDIFTRYRFRISVGKAFDDSIVMRNINSKVYAELDYAE